jgi:hypothetical protein
VPASQEEHQAGGREAVDVSTTHNDWDLWEQDLPPLRSRVPLPVKAAVGLVALAVAVAIVAPVVLVARAGDSPSPSTTVLRPPRPRLAAPSPSAPPSAAAPRPAAPLPTSYVATTTDGRLVVASEGNRRAAGVGALAPRVALMPGGQAAVVERSGADGRTDLQWWDLSGQPAPSGPPFAADARYPAFSPDGRQLAYMEGHPVASTLVVGDLAAGTERRWRFPEGHDLQLPSWAPDGRSLVLTEVTAAARRTLVFDTGRPEGPVADHPAVGGPYRLAAYRGARGTLVAAGGPAPSGYDVLDIDPATGASRSVYTTPFVVAALDPDSSGDHALLVTEKAALYVWANGSIYQVMDGVLDADW